MIASNVSFVFVDTCIIGNVVKGDCSPEDRSALSAIMVLPTSQISFGASTLVREEIEQIPKEYRSAHVGMYDTLRNFPTSDVTWVDESDPSIIASDTRYRRAQEILSGRTDAHLVVDAVNEQYDYFLTTDYKTVLRHASEVESEFSIKPVSPSQLAERWGLDP